jgi:predicted P-loop ATPase
MSDELPPDSATKTMRDAFESAEVIEFWTQQLLRDRKGEIRPSVANVITALQSSPAWSGVLGFDSFAQRTRLRKPAPWMPQDVEVKDQEWSSDHDVRATEWLHRSGVFCNTDVVAHAIETVAKRHSFHPVLEYLGGLKWDGIKRIDTWLIDCLGAANTPFNRAVGKRWLISAVARVHQPGCKADCALILEGPQGLLKSTALKTLGHPWFTDEVEELGSKDSAMQVAGVWIIEMGELDSMRRGEVTRIKAFLARTTDRFRPPYGRRVIELPRQSVMAGTTNKDTYLQDETGGRRFWPVACTKIDIAKLAAMRDQLWAEALACYQAGDIWWLEGEELLRDAADEAAARLEVDPWQEPIEDIIGPREHITVRELLRELKVPQDKQEPRAQQRVAACLKNAGWVRKQVDIKDGVVRPAGRRRPRRRWYVRGEDADPRVEVSDGNAGSVSPASEDLSPPSCEGGGDTKS